MRKLFMIDFRENGICKHQCLEIVAIGDLPDAYFVAACHNFVGSETELDFVVEVLADMTAHELNEISQKPESMRLPMRVLFVNVEELEKARAQM